MVALLDGDVAAPPLVPVGGVLPVGRVVVDPDRLEQLAAPPERTAWWRDRVVACAAYPLAATR